MVAIFKLSLNSGGSVHFPNIQREGDAASCRLLDIWRLSGYPILSYSWLLQLPRNNQ